MNLTIGKRRGLQQLSTDKGLLNIIAIDHRDVYKEMLQQGSKKIIELEEIVSSKLELIKILSPLASGILMDPIYCAYQSIERNIIPKDKGIMVSIEGNDYNVKGFDADNYLMEGISVESIKRMGASCVKLFIYYNPTSDICNQQEKLVEKLAIDCKKHEILFLLEPILYSSDQHEINIKEKVELMYEMIRKFKNKSVDIFKIEFPGDVEVLTLEENLMICKKVTSMIATPWIILSSGVKFELLKQQIITSCQGGASGIAIGRTLWKDYLLNGDEENCQNMKEDVVEIFEIINEYGRSWKNIYS